MTQKLIKEVIDQLEMIVEDAEMALDGRWDCSTDEGKETGFGAQIENIETLLTKIRKYDRRGEKTSN